MTITHQGRMWSALALAVSLLFTGSEARAQTLKVLALNFNSETVAFDDRKNIMRDIRYAAIVEFIRQEQPDIVFLAEAWNYRGFASVATPLGRDVGYDSYYMLGEGFPGLLYDSNVILAKKELHMEQRHTATLPHSAPHLGDRVNWIIPFGSISQLVGAKLTLAGGETLFVAATHLLAKNDGQHTDQMRGIDQEFRKEAKRAHARADQTYFMVGGDLNSGSDSPAIALAGKLGYVDTFAEAHPDHALDSAGATNCSNPYSPMYNPLTLGAGQLPTQDTIGDDGRIDYILARGPHIHTLASTVMFTHPYNGFWMSDHFGVLSTVEIGGGGGATPSIINPVTDSDELATLPPVRVLEIGDRDFAPCDHEVDCELTLPVQTVTGARGFALVNTGSSKIYAKLTGPGRVLPSAHSSLKPGRASSFVFMAAGDYTVEVTSLEGDVLRAPIHVTQAVDSTVSMLTH